VQRGTVIACSNDGASVFLDIFHDGSAQHVVTLSAVTDATKAQSVFTPKVSRSPALPVADWVGHLQQNGTLDKDSGRLYPPRCISMDGTSGTRGWIVGWRDSDSAFVVAREMFSPAAVSGPAAVFSSPTGTMASEYAFMTLKDFRESSGAVQETHARAVRDHFDSSPPTVTEVAGVRFPASAAMHIPKAYFAHLSGDRGYYPKDGKYWFTCPGDVCRVFAADTIFTHMHPLDCSMWDLSASLPLLEACKRTRDGLTGTFVYESSHPALV
jgi:hypothetical protein